MTYIEIVNTVLKKLREVPVASVTESAYSTMIGELVNEAKEEVESAWRWSHLRQYVNILTVAGTSNYILQMPSKQFTVLQVLNTSTNSIVTQKNYSWMQRQLLLGTPAEGGVSSYSISGPHSSFGPLVDLYPVPNNLQVIRFNVARHQSSLDFDTEELEIPDRPVILGAYYRAVKERGEDLGDSSKQAETDYRVSLSDAIIRDTDLYPDEITWQVD